VTDRLLRLVTDATPARPVGIGRILLGVAACLEVASTITSHRLDRVLRAGVIEAPRIDWLPRLSQTGGRLFLVAWLVAVVLFTVGWRTRATGGAALLAVTYYLALDQQLYSNHVYLLAVLLLLFVLADAGAAVSVDAGRGRGRADVPRWPVFLLVAQLAVVYGFATLSKLNADWLSGDVLAVNLVRIGSLDLPSALERDGLYETVAIGTILVEGFLAFAFYVPRLRRAAVLVGIAFHLSIIVTVDRWSPYAVNGFTVFALEMVALYAVCCGELLDAWSRAVRRRLPVRRTSVPRPTP
jgi:Vitamin K-dependent gamma-carboxylase